MSNYIPIREAAEVLDLSEASLYGANPKYRKYFRPAQPDTRYDSMFDVDGYRREQDLKEELLEKTKLLVEYLYHIEDMSYAYLARKIGVTVQSINSMGYGYNAALKICRFIKDYRKFHWKRFHEYYGWRIV